MNIAQIRESYPQYNDMSDAQLANALHAKYYSNMPLDTFYQQIGLGQTATPSQPQPNIMAGNKSLLNTVENSPGVNAILGAGDALRNTAGSALNLIPGVNISPVQSANGTAYNVGKIAGNVAAFMGGGEALDTARAAASGIPIAGQLASALGGSGGWGVARRALGNAIYGGLATNTDRTTGASEGAGLSVATDSLPVVGKALTPLVNYFQPSKYAKEILNNLGGGQNLQDASQSVLNSIKSAYTANKEQARDLYSPVLDSLSNSSIYNKVKSPDPLQNLYSPTQWDGLYPNTPFNPAINSDISALHNNFIQNPTLKNAHKLQSQLGTALGQLTNGITAPDQATWQTINSLGNARNALKTDINNFLQNSDPAIANQYQIASNYFRDNVAPYRNIPDIYKIATGETTNIKPTQLANLFSSPNANLQQVLSDLPQDAINKILYTKLGQYQVGSPEFALQNKINRLDQQGLGQFVSPELNSQLQSLQNRIHAKNALQMAAGAALGASTGMPIGLEGAVPLGVLGAGVGKPLINYMNNRLPIQKIGDSLKKGVQISYNPVQKALLANLLNNSGGQQ